MTTIKTNQKPPPKQKSNAKTKQKPQTPRRTEGALSKQLRLF